MISQFIWKVSKLIICRFVQVEVATGGILYEKVFLEILQNSHESTFFTENLLLYR